MNAANEIKTSLNRIASAHGPAAAINALAGLLESKARRTGETMSEAQVSTFVTDCLANLAA